MRQNKKAFTLVELLVVIGIIALLISILLPVLGSVRRQALKAKCATQLRELGNAMLMYAQDNRGFLPPSRVSTSYNIDGIVFNKGGAEVAGQSIDENAKWWNFLGKYLTKKQTMAQTAQQAGALAQGVFWCPSFAGYTDTGAAVNLQGGINRNATGYGMNWWPSFRGDYPPASSLNTNGFPMNTTPYQLEKFVDPTGGGSNPTTGKWWKLSQLTRPADRALLADGRQFFLEARKVNSAQEIPGQRLNFITPDYSLAGQTTYDFYRHGTYPQVENPDKNTGYFKAVGGKLGYNVLYADNHVAAPTDRESGYVACRMRFPG